MRQWESQINRLIKESAQRRAVERGGGMSRIATANSTNPAPQTRQQSSYTAPLSMYSQTSASRGSRTNPYSSDEPVVNGNPGGPYGGPQGYPRDDGFGFDEHDDDDYEDYPPASNYPASGRGTPMGSRKNANTYSMPPERDSAPGYERSRAQTEDVNGAVLTHWRNNVMPPPLPPPNGVMRSATRTISNASTSSYPDSHTPTSRTRPPLRSQFSSTRLRSGYENGEYHNARSPTPSVNVNVPPANNRSRSASQPTAYLPKQPPPPLPTSTQWHRERSNTSMGNNKRGSGSSQSTTGDSSDYSPNSSSPITPFGSSESSLGAVGIRSSRSQVFDHENTYSHSPPVKVKVHFHEDIFVLQVPRTTEYDDLVEKVGRKIRLCGPRRDDGPLRVKYRDEDGDMVSLGSTEDVQMAFEHYRPGGQVTLYVT